jgi:dolichyl-phosphate beta-glucosyltransferase
MTPRAASAASTRISSVSVVVPAYNEVRSIAPTLGDLTVYFATKPYDYEIIVAADGDDGTRELVTKLGVREPRLSVLGSTERRGKGFGVREGIRRARGDVIGFVDADNKTPISEFDKFEVQFASGFDVVIGSRALGDSRVERRQPLYRRMGSKVFAFGMHALVGLDGIADTQCGFKFFRRAAADDIFRRQCVDGYMFDVEILCLATDAGYRIAQVPVRWRDDGDSRLELVRGNLRNFADLLRIRFGSCQASAATQPAAPPGTD